MKKLFEKLEKIDRRIIYLLLFIVIVGAFFIKGRKLSISKNTQDVYDCIEKVAKENEESEKKKIALVVADWDAAVMAECDPQTEAIMIHLMRNNIKFAILGMNPVGPQYAERVAKRVAKQFEKEGIKKTYGIDWCNWGYKVPEIAVYRTLPKDIYAIVEADTKGKKIKDVPMMKDVNDFGDIGLIFHGAGSEMIIYWLYYVRNEVKAFMTGGCTGVMSAEYANYWKAKQVDGYLGALSGAAEYEQLLDVHRQGSIGMSAQSYGHLLIIVFIILGNIGYFLMRK